MYSALKYKGKPLYKLARQGIEIERKARLITIMKMELVDFEEDQFVLDILCSKGTYIRSLAEDMGARLDCGAHVSELRRLGSGPYDVEDCYTVDDLISIKERCGLAALDDCLLPLSTAVMDWPAVNLPEITAFYLRQGQAVQISHAPTTGWVRIFGESGNGNEEKYFIGVGEVLGDGRIAPRRLVASR
jgi:tRNA pseudouridine55 synthase